MNITEVMNAIAFLFTVLLIVMTIISIVWLFNDWFSPTKISSSSQELDVVEFTRRQKDLLRRFTRWTRENDVTYFLIRQSLLDAQNPEKEFQPTVIEVAITERDFDKITSSPFNSTRTSFGYRLTSLEDEGGAIHVFFLKHKNGRYRYSTKNHMKVWSKLKLERDEIEPLVPCRLPNIDVPLACPYNAVHHFSGN